MSQQKTKFIEDDAVTNAKLAEVATSTFKGRTTAGTGNPEDLTVTQATAILSTFVGDSGSGGTKGLVPAPAADYTKQQRFLNADGTFTIANIPENWIFYNEDFLNPALAGTNFSNQSTGTGSTYVGNSSLTVANRWGFVLIATGTTTTGRGAAASAVTKLSGGYTLIRNSIQVLSLSTVTDEYIFDVGFHDQFNTNNTPTTGVYFQYDRLTSTNWLAVSAEASTLTTTTTSVAVAADTWYNFDIIINAANTQVTYYINGVLVATHTTNIPTSTTNVRPCFRIAKSAGTTSTSAVIDYFFYQVKLGTAR
jgi:hypothetical protein